MVGWIYGVREREPACCGPVAVAPSLRRGAVGAPRRPALNSSGPQHPAFILVEKHAR